MANNESLKNQLQSRSNNTPEVGTTIKSVLANLNVKKRFEEVLRDRAPQFMASVINLVNSEKMLQNVDPMSVVSSCMVAATLDLPVDKNLGYAWVVPYSGKASFQLGWKGYVQLALRTAQYKNINVVELYEGQLLHWNPLTEEIKIDFDAKLSDKVTGYAAYFELINGFKKTVYWSREQVEAHRKKYSKSDFGWSRDWDAMAKKTLVRNMLSKWGILSIEMQKAYSDDLNEENNEPANDANYIDVDFTTGEIVEGKPNA